jgi:hypothetical protein
MKKQTVVSSKLGKMAFIFTFLSLVGIIFQFTAFYFPIIPISMGNALPHIIASGGILALAFGTVALILTIFKIPKWTWTVSTFFMLGFIIMPAATTWDAMGGFIYVLGPAFKYTWLQWLYPYTVPIIPQLDFIGFWMAFIFGVLAFISSFFLPKK